MSDKSKPQAFQSDAFKDPASKAPSGEVPEAGKPIAVAAAENQGDQKVAPADVSDDEDCYFDGPYLVFTEAYHLKRGYCCESGCRHCPYGFSTRTVGPAGPSA